MIGNKSGWSSDLRKTRFDSIDKKKKIQNNENQKINSFTIGDNEKYNSH